MKKNLLSLLLAITSILMLSINENANSQCKWQQKLYDGYEYSTTVPDLIPGTTIQTTPQSFAVHTGTKSLYMNFINTLPGGSLVYDRTITVCANVPIQISAWLTTSFSGVQCDARIEIVDANNIQLANTPSILCSYAPIWTQYQSGSITPTTSTIRFKLYTNAPGSPGGNDLSFDDLLVEYCNAMELGNDTAVCNPTTLLLNAGSGYSSYLWSNGSTNQTLAATSIFPGTTSYTYYVTAQDSNGCTFKDTINILFVNCASVNELNQTIKYTVQPNPANDFILIDIDSDLLEVKLFNAIGEKIKSFSNTKFFNVEDVSAGIYFLQIETRKGEVIYHKVIIE
ncbi:MAG TPA: T9SS type A sorting domain-containing protein [Bacteroidia bacterium]|nr:T9SS type A sorting domain-containing protein [Bacteroidia bacterium]